MHQTPDTPPQNRADRSIQIAPNERIRVVAIDMHL